MPHLNLSTNYEFAVLVAWKCFFPSVLYHHFIKSETDWFIWQRNRRLKPSKWFFFPPNINSWNHLPWFIPKLENQPWLLYFSIEWSISCSSDILLCCLFLFIFNILVVVQVEQILPFVSIFGSQFSLGQALILRTLVCLEYSLFWRLARITNIPNFQEINKGFLCSCTFNKFKPSSNWQKSPDSPTASELIAVFFMLSLFNFWTCWYCCNHHTILYLFVCLLYKLVSFLKKRIEAYLALYPQHSSCHILGSL